jgi:hypothetical protein
VVLVELGEVCDLEAQHLVGVGVEEDRGPLGIGDRRRTRVALVDVAIGIAGLVVLGFRAQCGSFPRPSSGSAESC